MDSTKHAKLMNMYGYAFLIIGSLSALVLFILWDSNRFSWLFIVPIILVMLIGHGILDNLPVYCDKPGCNGRMRVIRSRESPFTVEYWYECPDCGNSDRAYIFMLESKGHGGGR